MEDGADANTKPDDQAEIEVRATSNDTLQAFVMCTSKNVKYVTESRSVPTVSAATIKAKCPSDRNLVGGGVAAAPKLLQNTYPYDSRDKGKKPDDGWKASAQGVGVANMTVVAACSKAKASYTKRTLNLAPSTSSAVTPECKGNTHVSAIGARLTGATGFGALNSLNPRDGGDGDTVPDDGALVNMGNSGANPDPEKLTGTVVCVD